MKLIINIVILTISIIFTACGGGTSSDSATPQTATTVTGKFIDDPVQGLGYTCSSGTTGTTNSNGEYTCNVGDNVTFFINGVQLGTVSAQTTAVTPYSLFPNNNTASLNLARLLQSIDTGITNGNIVIDRVKENNIPLNTDFTNESFVPAIETALGITLVSEEEAQTTMNDAITSAGGSVPTDLNHMPIANSGIDQNVNTSSLVTLNASASSDADSDSLTYLWSITSKPTNSNATLSDATVVNPTFTADLDGAYVLSLVVNDGTVSSAADSMIVVSKYINHAPTLSTISEPSDKYEEFDDFNITLNAVDIENDTYSFSATVDNTSLVNTLVVNNQLKISSIPNRYGQTSINIFVTQENNISLFSEQRITLHILPVNDIPTIDTVMPDILVNEDNGTINYELNISDIDGDDIHLTVESNNTNIITVKQNWASLINQAGYSKELDFDLRTVDDANGMVRITLNVNDGDLNSTQTFDVNITAVDDAPVLQQPTVTYISESFNDFNISLNAIDVEGDIILFSANSSSDIETINMESNVLMLSFDTTRSSSFSLDINATSQGLIDSQQLDINLTRVVNSTEIVNFTLEVNNTSLVEEICLPIYKDVLIIGDNDRYGDIHDSSCTLTGEATIFYGMTLSSITSNTDIKIIYTPLHMSETEVPGTVYLTNNLESMVEVKYDPIYVGEIVFIEIDGLVYRYQLPTREIAENTNSNNAINLDTY